MLETDFVNDLMKHIIEGVKIPKVQVERAVSPILGLYVESILNSYFKDIPDFAGKYDLISPEFPLKKENNQSTNIDFLLVNNKKRILVFFELKTDTSSYGNDQIERYLVSKNRIRKCSSRVLKNDLHDIQTASKKGNKYMYIVNQFDQVVSSPEDIKRTCIFYLVPMAIKNQIEQKGKADFVLSFNDLPKEIIHRYSDFWPTIRANLLELDSYFEAKDNSGPYAKPLFTIV